MNPVLTFVFAAILSLPLGAGAPCAMAADSTVAQLELVPIPAIGIELSEFVWKKRVVAVFADSAADPAFVKQMRFLAEDPAALADREVVVITDTDPAGGTALRRTLRPRGFSIVWVDKDGEVRLRKPAPRTVRELTRAIDKTPLRIQELLERRAAPGG